MKVVDYSEIDLPFGTSKGDRSHASFSSCILLTCALVKCCMRDEMAAMRGQVQ